MQNLARRAIIRWGVGSLVVVVGLATMIGVAWPRLTVGLAGWTGEEEPVAQFKGVVNLADIWLRERPLRLDADRPLPHTSLRPYGVSVFLEQEVDEANVVRSLDMIQAAGFQVIRQQFPWEDIEIHAKGDFEDRRHQPARSAWAKYDRIVELAGARGLTIIARLDAPPDWARSDPAEHEWFGPPDRFEDYGDFVTAVVQRYQGRIKYLQIWNEPNIFPEWGTRPPDPVAYTRLLSIAARRARAIDPGMVIISAPLAPTLDHSERALYDLDYLDAMLEAGAAQYFDILGIIAYGLGSGPGDHRVVWHRTNFARPQLLRDALVRHGVGDKPAWILEMGWSAVPEGMDAPFGRVTDEQQARYLVGAYDRIEHDYPWVGVGVVWFFRRPNPEWLKRPEGYFRLVTPDWQPLPAYTALQAVATAPAVLPSGFQHVSHPGFTLSGPWRSEANTQAALATWVRGSVGSQISFTFDGSDATLLTRLTPASGILEYSVDGGPAQGVDVQSREEGALDLRLVADALPGAHRVELRVTRGEVIVEGVRVRRSTDGVIRRSLLGLALIAGGLGVVLALGRRVRFTAPRSS